ncbi:hypothetical protein RB195_011440 [Necator americanus]|uniref:Uncharacterized protein n=1 Tax=Necator americanus TaxID=51031 RepID=A0ABR1D2D1_NECAM
MSKSRLAPLRAAATIPRIELLALAIGAKLTNFLKTQIDTPMQKCYIWSGSKVTLQWSKCEKSLPVVINNRVNIIRTNAPWAMLRYVPSNLNAADIGSRGMAEEDFLHSELWFHGPKFLLDQEETLPEDITHPASLHGEVVDCFLTSDTDSAHIPLFDELRFSSWLRLLNTVIIILLFVVKKSSKAKHRFSDKRNQLLSIAEIIICRQAQLRYPPSETIKKQLNLHLYTP